MVDFMFCWFGMWVYARELEYCGCGGLWWVVVRWVWTGADRPSQCGARYKREFVSNALSCDMLVYYDRGHYCSCAFLHTKLTV